MTNTTTADAISEEEQKMPQSLELHLEMILIFASLTSDTGQERKANALRKGENNSAGAADEILVKRLSSAYVSSRATIDDRIRVTDTILKESKQITINEENIFNDRLQTEYLKVLSVLDGLFNKYSKVYLHIIVPSDNEMSVASHYFLKELFDDNFVNKYSSIIDSARSEISFLYFAGNPSVNSGTDDSTSEKPSDTEAKIAAIMSHYVYFYLDWLEYVNYYCKSIRHYQESNESIQDEFPYAVHEDTNGLGITKDGMLSFPSGEKIKLRIINRLKEIATVSNYKKDKASLIFSILEKCRRQGKPIEFHELYDAFGYWEHIGHNIGDEARKWFVSHPSIVAENDQKGSAYNHFLFIKWKKGKVLSIGKNKQTNGPIVFNSILTHGMSWLSGYGGLLFVKFNSCDTIDEKDAVKFAYCTKGTDVNSLNDWVFVDLLQAFTGFSLQHVHTVKNSITLDKKVRKFNSNIPLLFCGHSLGGGLASSSAIVSKGRHAITFNAAGLNFLGSLATRIIGAIANLNPGALHPTAIAKRVHPFRIKGEAVDALTVLAGKVLSAGFLERAYGSAPYVIDFNDFPLSESGGKHGINNFLAKPVITQLRIVEKKTSSKAVDSNIKKISLNDIINYKGDFIFMTQDTVPLKKYAQEATKFKNKEKAQQSIVNGTKV